MKKPVEKLYSCPNHKRGCKAKVKEQDTEKHVSSECLYRFVNCEACNRRLMYQDLVTHQKVRGCLENKLRQEIVKKDRVLSSQVRKHQKDLHIERVQHEMQKSRNFRVHLHEKIGFSPRIPSAWGNFYPASSRLSVRSRLSVPEQETEKEEMAGQDGEDVPPREEGNPYPSSPCLSRLGEIGDCPLACRKCKRFFRIHGNHERACFWHNGPIVPIFGGMCQTCGRLDFQEGCREGYHES